MHNRYYEQIDGKITDISGEIPFDLPDGWAWCRQQSIITLISGQDFPPDGYNDSHLGIPYITGASNMLNGRVVINRWTEHPSSIAVAGDVLITCKGAGVGKMAYMDIPQAHVARQIMAIRPHCNIPSKFIEVVLLGQFIIIREQMNGLIPGISRDVMLNLLFPLPPLAEQKRIVEQIKTLLGYVDVIDTDAETLEKSITLAKQKVLDLAIRGKLVPQDPADEPASELLKKIKAEKEALIKAGKLKRDKYESFIFKGDDNCYYEDDDKNKTNITNQIPFDLPSSWIWCRLRTLGFIIGGGTPSTLNPEFWNGKIPWLSPADLTDYHEKYICRGKKNITTEGLEHSSAVLMPPGSILYSSRAPIGYIVISQNSIATNQGFKSLVPAIDGISEFFFYVLRARTPDIKHRATGTTFKEISGAEFGETLVPLPPLAEQKRIVSQIEQIFAQLETMQD